MIAKKYKDLAWKLFSIFVLIFAVVMTFVVGKLWFSYQEGKNIESRLENKFFAQGAVLRMQDQGENPMTYASGSFVKVDMVHKATGGVDVYEIGDDVYVRLQNDFQVTEGPDLYIYLSGPQEYGGARGASVDNALNLGKLYRTGGEQYYKITKAEWEQYHHSVLIWCRAFGIHFSHAILEPVVSEN